MTTSVKNILIAGGTGLIGQRISALLESKSYNVFHLTRKNPNDGKSFRWDPEKKQIDPQSIEIADVIINLAGTNIGENRWTARYKRSIINSRIFSTNLLYETLKVHPNKVKLIINASGVSIYGNTGELIMNEESPVANDFLGQISQRWENAAHQFETLGIRTVIFRTGPVLSDAGGMLVELLKPLKFGIAVVFGNGKQYISWIHIDDYCKMISKAIRDENMNGIYNAVAPGPLSNKNFMKLLGQIRGKKFFLVHVPGFLLRLILGDKASIVLDGTRVSSRKITSTGYEFVYPSANMALRNLLGK